jgi:hypothetical protein
MSARLGCIHWIDASHTSAWHRENEEDSRPVLWHTYGMIELAHTEVGGHPVQFYRVWQSLLDGTEYREVSCIPKKYVVKITYYEEVANGNDSNTK